MIPFGTPRRTGTYKNWRDVDSSLNKLDSLQKAELTNLAAGDEHQKGTNLARNVLNFFYGKSYFTPAALPDLVAGKKEKEEGLIVAPLLPDTQQRNNALTIRIYPNPAKDVVTIAYNGVLTGGKVFIVNALGVLVDVKTLPDGNGKLTLHTGSYANGVYMVRIEADGKAVIKDKLVILE